MKKPLLCVVHIPKTAGTTIRETLSSILGSEKIYWIGNRYPIDHWESAAGSDFNDYLVVGGHVGAHAFEKKIRRPKAYLTLVREPIQRVISLFDFITKGPDLSHPLRDELKGMTLIEAVEKSSRFRVEVENRQCTLIGGAPRYSDALKSISEKIWFINRHEHIEDLIRRVCEAFEWSFKPLIIANVSRRVRYFEEYHSTEIIAALREINQQDIFLYESLTAQPKNDEGASPSSTDRIGLAKEVRASSIGGSAGPQNLMPVPVSTGPDAHWDTNSLSLSIDDFVTSAYKAILGRHPDPTGLRDRREVLSTMPAAQGVEGVMRALLNSKEFEKRHAEAQGTPPQIAVFTPAQAEWLSSLGTRVDRVLLVQFRPEPGLRPTIYVLDHSLLTIYRILHSITYLDRLISKYLLHSEYYYLHLGSTGTFVGDMFCLVQLDDRGADIDKSIGYCRTGTKLTLVPDLQFWIQNGYFQRRQEFTKFWVPWEDRVQSVFWRGSSTGAERITLESLRRLPRFRLCAASTNRASLRDVLDAKLTDIVQASNADEAEKIHAYIDSLGLLAAHVPQPDFLKYRFQIDIDGNSNSWGFLPKLMMGSCILKVVSDWRQWYYDGLRPWEHYVPIKDDLSDLEERVAWCLDNDDAAREIGANGMRYANEIVFGMEMLKAADSVLRASRETLDPAS